MIGSLRFAGDLHPVLVVIASCWWPHLLPGCTFAKTDHSSPCNYLLRALARRRWRC